MPGNTCYSGVNQVAPITFRTLSLRGEQSSLAFVQLPEADLGALFDLALDLYDDPYRRKVLADLLERGGASGRASWLGQLVLADQVGLGGRAPACRGGEPTY